MKKIKTTFKAIAFACSLFLVFSSFAEYLEQSTTGTSIKFICGGIILITMLIQLNDDLKV